MYSINKIENGNEMKLHDDLPTYDSAKSLLDVMHKFVKTQRKMATLHRWQLVIEGRNPVVYQIISPYVA